MTALHLLETARALIADPEHWCQNASARDANNTPLMRPTHISAVKWCAIGAGIHVIGRVVEYDKRGAAEIALRRALAQARVADGRNLSVEKVNDFDGHATVLAMYDLAIANERMANERVVQS